VIPRGTPAMGEVTWRTGKGAFGKSGKLEFSLRYIDLGGQHIPVTGDFRQEGEGNTLATGVTHSRRRPDRRRSSSPAIAPASPRAAS
jgi:hypothetical protein